MARNNERLRSAIDEDRMDREITEGRQHSEDRVATDAHRAEEFSMSFDESALPRLPPLPGYHVCWLSTTNTRDSLPSRIRAGYRVLTYADFPGFTLDGGLGDAAPADGTIRVNEMVAACISLERYQAIMKHFHHDKPLEAVNEIGERAYDLEEQMRRVRPGMKHRISDEGGFGMLRDERKRAPTFEG